MAKKIVIDPITRIEGHLRIEVEIEGGKVKNAWSSGQMFRGIEIILQGRVRQMRIISYSDRAGSELTPMHCPR